MTSRTQNFSAWYNEIITKASLAEHSSTRGCIVLKPYGFALWESIRHTLDTSFKKLGHQNVYFPLLIPMHHLTKEAKHIDGFATECAAVTHYRLKRQHNKIIVDPDAKLEEPLIIRPTSETIIWEHFSKWIQSHRDLPLLINQWANVVRWEKRTRPFLRTMEFLWQEGHTAHATQTEANQHALRMLHNYIDLFRDHMALPLIAGEKTPHERFAGAQNTYTMEGLMQDGKALQLGTAHFLGQNFAKAFDVTYADKQGTLKHVWGTSWGITTRLLGALIMTHADDQGLVIPPTMAPIQAVIIPIYHKSTDNHTINQYAQQLTNTLTQQGIRVKLDTSDSHHPGWKFTHYELQGIPLRIIVGPKEIAEKRLEVIRRDTGHKQTIPHHEMATYITATLTNMQKEMFATALQRQTESIHYVDTFDEFKHIMHNQKGFIMAHWDGNTATEIAIQEATKATIRCIPFDSPQQEGHCVYTGRPSKQRVLFAQAY